MKRTSFSKPDDESYCKECADLQRMMRALHPERIKGDPCATCRINQELKEMER